MIHEFLTFDPGPDGEGNHHLSPAGPDFDKLSALNQGASAGATPAGAVPATVSGRAGGGRSAGAGGFKDLKLGFHEVFGQLYDDLGLARLWPQNQRGAERVFRQLMLARLAAPGKSKRHLAAELSEQGVNLPLERVYRMMDRLNRRRQSRLLKHLDGTVRGLLGGPVEVVFLDATTLSSATEVEDDL